MFSFILSLLHCSRHKNPLQKKVEACKCWKSVKKWKIKLFCLESHGQFSSFFSFDQKKREKKVEGSENDAKTEKLFLFIPQFTPFTSSSHLNASSVIKANICIVLSPKGVIRMLNKVFFTGIAEELSSSTLHASPP